MYSGQAFSPLPQWTHHHHHQSPKYPSSNMNFEVIGIKKNGMRHLQWVFSPNLTVQTTNQSNTLWQTWWLWISSSSKCLLCFWDNFKMQLWDTTLANMVTLNFEAAPIAPNVFVDQPDCDRLPLLRICHKNWRTLGTDHECSTLRAIVQEVHFEWILTRVL